MANLSIAAVFLAQTHVLPPDSPYFRLVGGRPALLKVQLTGAGASPLATAMVTTKAGEEMTLTLSGPSTLPSAWDGRPGEVDHKLSDSFTATIPAPWVSHGMAITVSAGGQSVRHELTVGSPSPMQMLMFDVHYFGTGEADYPTGWEAELASKWPVSSFDAQRIRGLRFLEMVIPARTDVGSPAVRIASKDDYADQTGLPFDGEQAAALEWVHALSAAGGNQDTQMCYVNILGVPAGGQAGAFDGVGAVSAGILNHELGHAFSLPHWGTVSSFPYRGDMHGVVAPVQDTHVGPHWAYDLPHATFLPPTCAVSDPSLPGCTPRALTEGETPPAFVYKASPMQGGGDGDQPAPFLFRHFSDYGVAQMQSYIEGKLAVNVSGSWKRWDDDTGSFSAEVAPSTTRYPIETGVELVSVMASCTLAGTNVSMVYPPVGPYTAGLIRLFDAESEADRAAAETLLCPSAGCDFSLRVQQGEAVKTYMLAASGAVTDDPYSPWSLTTVALNLPVRDGDVLRAELLYTPDVQAAGLPAAPAVLHSWASDRGECGDAHFPATASANTFHGAVRHGEVADFVGATGEYVEWAVSGCTAGSYTISFDYYAGSCDRPLRLLLDGEVVASSLSFPSTGGWDALGTTAPVAVALGGPSSQTVAVRLESIGYSGNNILAMNLHAAAAPTRRRRADEADEADGDAAGCAFYTKAVGGESCPPGEVTATEALCREAAAEFGMPFSKSVDWPSGRPAGCFWDTNGAVYFNVNLETTDVWDGTGGACRGLPQI